MSLVEMGERKINGGIGTACNAVTIQGLEECSTIYTRLRVHKADRKWKKKIVVLQSKDRGRMQEGCPVRRNKIDEGEETPGDRISTCVKNGHSINNSSGNGEKN